MKKPSVILKDGELSAVKTNLAHLLTEMVLHPSSIAFSQHEADNFLGSYFSFFQDTHLIVDAPSRKWANCLSCGKTHEVTPINGLLVLSCSEPEVEDVIITAEELKSVRFNPSGLYSWLQNKFSLQGEVEVSDGRALLGRGTVDSKQRLFIFSHENSPEARKAVCEEYLANHPVILYLSTTLNNPNQGYDINLAEYLVVQKNDLSIDASSALSVIIDTIPLVAGRFQTQSSGYAIQLKLQDNEVVVTGTSLGGSYPAFNANRSSTMSRLIRTLLKLHENSKETTFQTYTQSVIETNYIDPRNDKTDDLSKFNLSQSKRSLSKLCSSLLPYFLSHSHHKDDGLVVEFRSAISQEDWNKLSDPKKQKILASKSS